MAGPALTDDVVARALAGEGPLHAAMLADRARDLAVAETWAAPLAGQGEMQGEMLVLRGRSGPWLLPLVEALRVAPRRLVTPLPGTPLPAAAVQAAAILGLALLSGRRWLVIDLDAALAGTAPQPVDGGGHAVLLRRHPLALAVDRAEAVMPLPAAAGVVVDVDRVLAALTAGATP